MDLLNVDGKVVQHLSILNFALIEDPAAQMVLKLSAPLGQVTLTVPAVVGRTQVVLFDQVGALLAPTMSVGLTAIYKGPVPGEAQGLFLKTIDISAGKTTPLLSNTPALVALGVGALLGRL